MKSNSFVRKTVVSNIQCPKTPPAKVVRHPTSRSFKCTSAVVIPCQCIIQPVYNSTKPILNLVESLNDKKLDSHKLLLDEVFQNDTLMKSVNQKAAQKVSIPFYKKQFQNLIGIDFSYSANKSE